MTVTTDMDLGKPGAPSGPQTTTSTSLQYWAKGVGLVKTVDGDGASTTVVTKVVNP